MFTLVAASISHFLTANVFFVFISLALALFLVELH